MDVLSLYTYRRFIWQRSLLDMRVRYASTGFGIVWNVLNPLLMIATYAFVFTVILPQRYPTGDVPYAIFLCSGLIPWTTFSDCVSRGAACFRVNAPYLSKLPVPEQVFVAETALTATLNLGVAFSLLIVISMAFGHQPSITWLLLPIPLVMLQALGFGIGLAVGTLNVFFRDLEQVIPLALRLGMWMAPVIFPLAKVPETWGIRQMMYFHPATPALDSIHRLFLDGVVPAPMWWLGMAAWVAAALVAGFVVLGLLRREIRDVL
jgi:lipopolysaccharide transport system permease protein